MGGSGVIDHFLEVFTRYIDSGFGLLQGEVAFIATTLIVIDVTLAALFWSWGADNDIIARLIKKTLFVGVFAYIIGNWNNLARIVFESFAGLGLKASGTGFSVSDLMRPGKVAQTGLDAGRPLLDSISDLMGWVSFFENFIQIACLLFAWALILLAFFILAVQLFVTLIEFKLTTLAGFVLIPFGLFGKSAFMAERVLGNVISSGIKVMVLAVIIGIGSTLFSEFTAGFNGATPTIDDAMAIVLAALSLAPPPATPSAQDRQLAFLNQTPDKRTVSPDRVAASASANVLQAGAVIAAALITGIRSDLPGQITAQVTENVYDSPTGRILLVPQGTRIIGQYYNGVGFGQRRVLLVWNRLIFPNGRSIVLERQPGADAEGYAGLEDGVDYHWGELFKAAALSTLLSVGAEAGSSGQESDIIRALRNGASDSINQTGQQIVQRQLNIAPTLTIRPGFPVRVIVTRDLVLEPYGG